MILELGLALLYVLFTVWVVWTTFLNIVLGMVVPACRGDAWNITSGQSWVYIALWSLVFFLPYVGAVILD